MAIINRDRTTFMNTAIPFFTALFGQGLDDDLGTVEIQAPAITFRQNFTDIEQAADYAYEM